MFEINLNKSYGENFQETQNNLKKIEGIEKFYQLQKEIYHTDFLDWGDDQIDELHLHPNHTTLTVRICSSRRNIFYNEKKIKRIFWMIDFYDIELHYFDIAPEHWIDDIIIQQNVDGKYSISFGNGGLDFRYSSAKVNRCWIEYF